MNIRIFLLGTLACLTLSLRAQHVPYVDPFIGTAGMGHTFPGACVPFGGVQLSPDTDVIPHNILGEYQPRTYEYCAGYQYGDSTIVGFSHTHFSGTGHSDLGDILLMPGTGDIQLVPGTAEDPDAGYRQRFSHDTETAGAGHYEVTLADSGIRAELTATQRVGVHRYTYPAGADGHVILDLNHGIYNYDGKTLWAEVRVVDSTLVTGYRITNGWARTNYTYFAIRFSQPVIEYGYKDLAPSYYNGGYGRFSRLPNFPEMAGRKLVAWFRFDTASEPELTVQVGISATGMTGALKNLEAEADGKSFDTLRASAEAAWERELSCVDIEGTEAEKKMFYTSLYHTMINPSVYMDVDGLYRGLDHELHQAEGFTNYTVFSLWDTYRAEHPLLALLKTSRAEDMVASMLRHYEQSPHHMLPIWSHMANENWCMTGYHSVSVLADAIVKGLKVDGKEALEAMVSTSRVPWYGGLGEYMQLGYVPLEKTSTAASNTLEFAYDDWTIAAAAAYLGEEGIAREYRERALNYRNVFDPSLGLARPRHTDGSFLEPFDVKQTVGQGFIEGNSLNYSFHVPQDVPGLIALMGGDKRFIANLDELFGSDLPEYCYADNEDITAECLLGGYVHGNEPSHHIPYLYAWTSEPWKTQYWVREIVDRFYKPEIRGLGGNDDCGQMSAWYIFTVLGFYPVCPGTDQYVLGAPCIPSATVRLENGNTLQMTAKGLSARNRYVKSVKLNGKPLNRPYLTHAELLAGGTLEFRMAASSR